MDGKTALSEAIKTAQASVDAISGDDWHKSTPCTEWDLTALLKHMVYELLWAPDLFAGKTIAEVGDKYETNVLGDNPIGAWQDAADKVNMALVDVDPERTVHLSAGDVTADAYMRELALDMLVHGWDVSKSITCPYEASDELVKTARDYFEPRMKDYQASGSTAAEVIVGNDVSPLDHLIALTGRKP